MKIFLSSICFNNDQADKAAHQKNSHSHTQHHKHGEHCDHDHHHEHGEHCDHDHHHEHGEHCTHDHHHEHGEHCTHDHHKPKSDLETLLESSWEELKTKFEKVDDSIEKFKISYSLALKSMRENLPPESEKWINQAKTFIQNKDNLKDKFNIDLLEKFNEMQKKISSQDFEDVKNQVQDFISQLKENGKFLLERKVFEEALAKIKNNELQKKLKSFSSSFGKKS